MSKNMFAALNVEEDEQVHVEQQPQQVEPQKPVKLFTVEDMANEQNTIEGLMRSGMSWYDIFMRDDEEKRWREEAKFGKSDDWTDITKKVKIVAAPKRARVNGRH
jgi:hypothetical protein